MKLNDRLEQPVFECKVRKIENQFSRHFYLGTVLPSNPYGLH